MKLKQKYENWMETGELPKPGLCRCVYQELNIKVP